MTKKKTPPAQPTARSNSPGKGRPRGSKTAQRTHVDRTLPRCRRCQATDLRVEGIARRLVHSGLDLHTSQPFNLTLWHRCVCHHCGAKLLLRTHFYVPNPATATPDPPKNGQS